MLLLVACNSRSGRDVRPVTDDHFTIRFAGDVIMAVSMDRYIREKGPGYPVARVRDWLMAADHTVCNLESCYTTNGTAVPGKAWTFRARPEYMAILAGSGVDAVSLANNHLLDFGKIGMDDTLATLRRFRIPGFGAGRNLDEAFRPHTVFLGQGAVYFFSVCGVDTPAFHAGTNRPGTAPLDMVRLRAAISNHRHPGALIIVQPHWGYERQALPNPEQRRQAREMIDAGADAVIGHHPHVPQSIEIYRNKPIVYSLGNFIVGYWNSGYRNNIGVTLHCREGRIAALRIHSFAGRNHLIDFQPFLVTGEAGKEDMRYLEMISRPFGTKILIEPDGTGRIELPPGR